MNLKLVLEHLKLNILNKNITEELIQVCLFYYLKN